MANTLGAKIKLLRETNKMTQEELANKLGTTKQSVSNYETGKRRPDYEMLETIADTFNVNMGDLLGTSKSEMDPIDHIVIYQDSDYTLTSPTRRMKDGAADFLHGTLDTMTEPCNRDDTSSTSSIPSRDEIFDWLNTYWLMAADDGTNIERYTDEELLDYYYAAREAYEEEMERED